MHPNAPPRFVVMPPRILIVEDDALTAISEEDTLSRAGYEVVGIARRCRSAIKLARNRHPDLAVMDVRLAGDRDGILTAIIIYQIYAVPSLFTTVQSVSALALRARPARPRGYLQKPFHGHELVGAVAKALEE